VIVLENSQVVFFIRDTAMSITHVDRDSQEPALENPDETGSKILLEEPVVPDSLNELSHLARIFNQDLRSTVTETPYEPAVRALPIAFAREHLVLILQADAGGLSLAIGQSESLFVLDLARRLFNQPIQLWFVEPEVLLQKINEAYESHGGTARELLDTIDHGKELVLSNERQDLLDSSGRAPVIRLVNQILFEAIKSRASDIHIQPGEGNVVARFRIDGVLFDAIEIPKGLQDEVVSRIKVLGNMNIAEKRLPQDGRATVRLAERVIDLRIASLPTSHSERVVIRLLDKSARRYTLTDLGMPDETLARFRRMICLEHGLLLVTGPTGSGKSTTLYAALQQISTRERNVLTLEDPIEYELEGVSQTQINEKKGLTFARGLRNVLRQDPDIIMVGEIRDHETAVMAIQSSLTGHLVFSTLHTNDSASAVTRLLDLGIEPYLVSSSLLAVLAQRLVRQICSQCRTESTADEELKFWLDHQPGVSIEQIYEGVGCEACRKTGYRGRLGIFEFLIVDEQTRGLIQSRASATQIRSAALKSGLQLLVEDGLRKISSGMTTLSEVVRVAQRPDDGLEATPSKEA